MKKLTDEQKTQALAIAGFYDPTWVGDTADLHSLMDALNGLTAESAEQRGHGHVVERSDAVNLARNLINADVYEDITPTGVRILCEAVLDMDAALLTTPPTQPAGVPEGWQSIETAPKDGRTMLLGYLNRVGNWRTVRGQWMSAEYIGEYWEDPDCGDPGWYETCAEGEDIPNCWGIDPTHWMPLPAAPQPAAQDIPAIFKEQAS